VCIVGSAADLILILDRDPRRRLDAVEQKRCEIEVRCGSPMIVRGSPSCSRASPRLLDNALRERIASWRLDQRADPFMPRTDR
jgi:hypothetical protein